MATRLHVWDGSKFVPAKEILVWNGSSWSPKREGYFWDGSKWVPIIEYRQWYYESGIEHVPWVQGYRSRLGGRINKYDTYFSVSIDPTVEDVEIACVTDVAVNLTGLSRIYVDWSGSVVDRTINTEGLVAFIVSTSKTGNRVSYNSRIAYDKSFSRKVDVLDVSGLNGYYYLRFHAVAEGTDDEGVTFFAYATARVYNVYAE